MEAGAQAEQDAWSRALQGDGRAFAALFDLHHDRVFRHVTRLVRSFADADEVTASAFLELWRRRDAVRVVNGSLLPWLLITAVNLARNHGRRTGRYSRLLHELAGEHQHDDPSALAEAAIERAQHRRSITEALRRLKLIDAQLVALTMLDSLSITEAAGVLGLSPGAARVRLHRARQRLRDAIPNPYLRATVEEESR